MCRQVYARAMEEKPPKQSVRITVTGDCGHVLGTWTDTIEDKYPFYCEECDLDKRTGKYPWKLTTEIITPEAQRS